MSTWHTLVEAPALAARLGAPSLVVFDCRHDLAKPDYGRDAFAAGRIPYARFLHLDDDLSGTKTGRNGRHPLPAAEDFVALMRRHGVSDTTQVVAYDDAGGMYAARLWWMLRWVGHDAVAVLDGGLPAWRDAALPISTDAPLSLPEGTLSLRGGAANVSADELLANLTSGGYQVVDARAPDRFRGENETLDPVGGHIMACAARRAIAGSGGEPVWFRRYRLPQPAGARSGRLRWRAALRRIVERVVRRPGATGRARRLRPTPSDASAAAARQP